MKMLEKMVLLIEIHLQEQEWYSMYLNHNQHTPTAFFKAHKERDTHTSGQRPRFPVANISYTPV